MGGLVRFDVCYANDLLSNLPTKVMLCYWSLLLHLPPVVMLHYWSLRHEFEKLVAISNLFTIGCDFLRMKVVFGIEKRPLPTLMRSYRGKWSSERAVPKKLSLGSEFSLSGSHPSYSTAFIWMFHWQWYIWSWATWCNMSLHCMWSMWSWF